MASQDQEELGRAIKRRRISWSSYAPILQEQPDSAVLRLPVEILLTIFHLLSHTGYHGATDPDWISTTHVCQHWRNVALSNPTLWRTIVFRIDRRLFDLVLVALERSGQATLDIRVAETNRYASDEGPLWSAIVREMHRIRTLVVDVADCRFPGVCEALPISAPQLRSLSVAPRPFSTSRGIFTCLDARSLAAVESLKISPSVQLTRCWHLFQHMTSLKHLVLTDSGSLRLSLEDTVDALSSFTELQTLEIRNRFDLEGASDVVCAILPNLRRLDLSTDIFNCIALLDSLDIPPQTRILAWAKLNMDPSDPLLCAQLIDIFCARATLVGRTRHYLEVDDIFGTGLSLDWVITISWYKDEDELQALSRRDQVSPLEVTISSYGTPREDVLLVALLESIDALRVSQNSAWARGPSGVAGRLMRHCNNIQVLDCYFIQSHDIADLLDCANTVSFPQLHTLYLTSIQWTPCHLHNTCPSANGDLCPLLHVLARRQALGYRISRLIIASRSVPKSMPKEALMEALAPFILEVVIWDGGV